MSQPSQYADTLNALNEMAEVYVYAALDLERKLAAIRAALEEIVCVVPPDDGVVLLSEEGTSHTEIVDGKPMQVYDHEHFSPLGDALMAAWRLTLPGGTASIPPRGMLSWTMPGGLSLDEWCSYWLNEAKPWIDDKLNVDDALDDLQEAVKVVQAYGSIVSELTGEWGREHAEVERLRRDIVGFHRTHCTPENCTLDGGDEHAEAFAAPVRSRAFENHAPEPKEGSPFGRQALEDAGQSEYGARK